MSLKDVITLALKKERHIERKDLRYDYDLCSLLESWSNMDDRSFIKPKIGEIKSKSKIRSKDKSENPHCQTDDIRCFECLGYGHVIYECLNKKVVTIDSENSANVEIVLIAHENKKEGQLCVKIHDQTNEVEASIIYKEKCEKEEVVCEEIKIECESKENEGVKVIEVNKDCL